MIGDVSGHQEAGRPGSARLCPVLIGRDVELAELTRRLRDARDGRGGLVFVTGEPGIGKSRLVREFATQARAHGVPVALGRAVPAGASVPYRPWAEALAALLRGRPMPDDDELRPWLPALSVIMPALAGTGDQGDASVAVRGEALVRLSGCMARPAGLLLILEDLHWADADTLAVLEYVADNLAEVPVLCVVTARGEPPSAVWGLLRRLRGRGAAVHLPLCRLDADQVARMVRACLGDESGSRGLETAAAVADGVPFLVEEVLVSPGVPASFADTVDERLAEVGDRARTVLQAAAVLGRRFDWRLLGPMLDLTDTEVTGALERGDSDQLDHLVAAVQQHAAGSHGHDLDREHILGEVVPATKPLATQVTAGPSA